uniref:Phosphopantothenoylcysteine decarboxylase n=1 Tax=Rhizophora mucronata TaxID=61149 RepID=A0A2P2P3J1_RHIMU
MMEELLNLVHTAVFIGPVHVSLQQVHCFMYPVGFTNILYLPTLCSKAERHTLFSFYYSNGSAKLVIFFSPSESMSSFVQFREIRVVEVIFGLAE